ncbi:MAG: DUF2207 domain-containing protein [Candidatus Bathyarchaeota archaeon]|nr:DUF2207 domain-containing protein [Candidatus Bathyarchaeota archaeon]
MVNRAQLLLAFLLACILAASAFSFSQAQSPSYTVNQEWAQLFINQDGTVDLTYNMSLTVTSGTLSAFDLGQPNTDFTIGEAVDQYGNQLHTYKFNDEVASVDFHTPLTAGESIWYIITTNVAGMMQTDSTNEGNLGMEFTPQWDKTVPISDVRVQIVFPEGVTVDDVKTLPDKFWNSSQTVEGRTALYWELPALGANQQYPIGVSFPAAALPNYTPPAGIGALGIIFAVAAALAALFIIIFIAYRLSKKSYTKPKVGIETLGVKRGLTAVEASYLLDLKPQQIVTEILYSLLQKRAVWATETKPSLKLKVLSPYESKTGTKEKPLRYYEIDFLQALKPDGSLDEEKLAHAVMFLRDTVEQKLQGYSRKDTADYYQKIVAKAWLQVEQAGTPELASNAYDQQLLWLMMDPDRKGRTETIFRDRPFQPQPLWFWWWYGYTIYHPHPIFTPNVNAPSQMPTPAPVPGADFANNIATAVEGTANNVVVNLEKFANAIVPPPPKSSHQPARKGGDCVCACAACACACACVSCACACAGGGGR